MSHPHWSHWQTPIPMKKHSIWSWPSQTPVTSIHHELSHTQAHPHQLLVPHHSRDCKRTPHPPHAVKKLISSVSRSLPSLLMAVDILVFDSSSCVLVSDFCHTWFELSVWPCACLWLCTLNIIWICLPELCLLLNCTWPTHWWTVFQQFTFKQFQILYKTC